MEKAILEYAKIRVEVANRLETLTYSQKKAFAGEISRITTAWERYLISNDECIRLLVDAKIPEVEECN